MAATGCATGPPAADRLRATDLEDSRGTLDIELPTPAVGLVGGDIYAWAMVEVPAGSRVQATKVMAQAAARAELSTFIRVSVATVMRDHASSAGPQRIERLTREVTARALPAAPPPEFGWRTVDGKLRMVSRVRVPLAALRTALVDEGEAELAQRLVDVLKR